MTKNLVNGFVEEKIDGSINSDSADNEEMDVQKEFSKDEDSDEETNATDEPKKILKKRKKGIIYVANIPKHMNVTLIREYLGQFGDIGRVYLQPEKSKTVNENKKCKKKRKLHTRHFTEGWVEFTSKRVAKQIAEKLNNTQIGTRKKSPFYDSLWSIKYLPRFKWVHLSERMSYEAAVHKQKLMAEVSQARKEANFFQNNLDKSEMQKKKEKNEKKMKVKDEN